MKISTTLCLLICLLLALRVPSSPTAAQTTGTTTVGIFSRHAVAPGQRLILPVEVNAAQDLYAIDLALRFDPTLLKIVDSEPNTAGTQVALGSFLDPGLLLRNEVDDTTGTLRFVMSQANPSEAKSGDGVLLVVTFEGLNEGVSDLKITTLEMSDRDGLAITGQAVDTQVTVEVGVPEQSDPGIPTQQLGTSVVVPTSMPTAVPTPILQSTSTLQASVATQAQSTGVLQEFETTVEVLKKPTQASMPQAQLPENIGNSTILIVASAVGVLLVLAAIALLRRSKSDQTGEAGKQ